MPSGFFDWWAGRIVLLTPTVVADEIDEHAYFYLFNYVEVPCVVHKGVNDSR
jgi:hypothetical protein